MTFLVSFAKVIEEFVAQLSDEELCDINRGDGGMGSALGTEGNAGAYAGITESLRAKGIPAVITADGPAGLRVSRFTTLLPCGTAIACSFNEKLVEELFELVGNEATHFSQVILLQQWYVEFKKVELLLVLSILHVIIRSTTVTTMTVVCPIRH